MQDENEGLFARIVRTLFGGNSIGKPTNLVHTTHIGNDSFFNHDKDLEKVLNYQESAQEHQSNEEFQLPSGQEEVDEEVQINEADEDKSKNKSHNDGNLGEIIEHNEDGDVEQFEANKVKNNTDEDSINIINEEGKQDNSIKPEYQEEIETQNAKLNVEVNSSLKLNDAIVEYSADSNECKIFEPTSKTQIASNLNEHASEKLPNCESHKVNSKNFIEVNSEEEIFGEIEETGNVDDHQLKPK